VGYYEEPSWGPFFTWRAACWREEGVGEICEDAGRVDDDLL